MIKTFIGGFPAAATAAQSDSGCGQNGAGVVETTQVLWAVGAYLFCFLPSPNHIFDRRTDLNTQVTLSLLTDSGNIPFVIINGEGKVYRSF